MPALLCAFLASVAIPVEPAPVPSGMDLLYDDHVPLLPNGEPIVTLGVASGESRIAVRASSPMRVDFYEENVFKQAQVPANVWVEVRIKRAQPAARSHYVDIEGIVSSTPERVQQALDVWRRRGIEHVTSLEEGTVLGMGGRVLDNRSVRIVLPAPDASHAEQLARRMARRFGGRPQAKERLAERPWGELTVAVGNRPLGVATSYARLSTDGKGLMQVADVEFGQGYSWHGRADRSYRDELYAVVDPNGRLAAVNALGAETILAGVVPAEIFSSSPMEALKAQAVAARNTLLAKLGRRHFSEPFHLCAEQHCQVYAGANKEDPRTTEAVRATAGQVLFLNGVLVDAVYSASCGGHTEDNEAVWGDNPNPALRGRPDFDPANPVLFPFVRGINHGNVDAFVRMQPDTYCRRSAHPRPDKFRWQKTLTKSELERLVRRTYPSVGPLRDIVELQRGPGGRLLGIRLVGDKQSVTVQRELPIRQLFGNLNSAAFSVERHRDADGHLASVTFVGGGWGHGVGMCQLGAIGRAEAGQNYQHILAHYYNGAKLQSLYGRR